MKDKREFVSVLRSIHDGPIKDYARLTGDFDFTRYVIHIRREPAVTNGVALGLFVIHVPQIIAGFPPSLLATPIRRTAMEDYILRRITASIDRHGPARDQGEDCPIVVSRPGTQILPRSAIIIAQDYVEARLRIHLPSKDGRVDAEAAERLFFGILPEIVNDALIYCYQDESAVLAFVDRMEDADHIRRQLPKRGLVSFVASGATSAPGQPALGLPENRLITLDVPNAGSFRGLGIPTGITLIVGDPYSGRQDLIAALAAGIYNHVPGRGPDSIVSIPDIVRIDADPGRSVQRVNITPFLLPGAHPNPAEFTTTAATPAESQMAGFMEAIQVGAQALIFDESTSDPAFLAGDPRIGGLRTTPSTAMLSLAVRARQIANDLRVSIVVGAYAHAAVFLPVADTVLLLEGGKLTDVTGDVEAMNLPKPAATDMPALPPPDKRTRWIVPASIDPWFGTEEALIEAQDARTLRFGRSTIDLSAVSQLADKAQTTAIGLMMVSAKIHLLDESKTVAETLEALDQDLATEGLDSLSRELRGDMARPRRYEVAAALNRLPGLRISGPPTA